MRRPFGAVPFWGGCFDGRASGRRIPRKNPALTIPIQRAMNFAGSFYVFKAWKGTVTGHCALCSGGVL